MFVIYLEQLVKSPGVITTGTLKSTNFTHVCWWQMVNVVGGEEHFHLFSLHSPPIPESQREFQGFSSPSRMFYLSQVLIKAAQDRSSVKTKVFPTCFLKNPHL